MNEDEAKECLKLLGLPTDNSHVIAVMGGCEVGKKIVKDKVSKRFAISHIDWREYEIK